MYKCRTLYVSFFILSMAHYAHAMYDELDRLVLKAYIARKGLPFVKAEAYYKQSSVALVCYTVQDDTQNFYINLSPEEIELHQHFLKNKDQLLPRLLKSELTSKTTLLTTLNCNNTHKFSFKRRYCEKDLENFE